MIYTVDINDYISDEGFLEIDEAQEYATDVAKQTLELYIEHQKQKGVQDKMNTTDLNTATQAVMTETQTNAALISGEILLDNIETIADRLVLSKMSWWQKLISSKKNRELAVTVATYVIVHGIKTGGFGLTKYRINHKALDFVTLAANGRIIKAIVKSAGVDTNVAKMLFALPEITKEG